MSRSVPAVRVATYNIHKCRGLDRRTNPARIAKVIQQLDADIVALQEVLDVRDGKPEYDQARALAQELPDYHWTFGKNRQLHGGAYGNMTFSRWPASFSRNYDLTWRHRERRGCLRTDFDLDNKTVLHVFNVHLGTSFVERRHQARRLAGPDVLDKDASHGARVVVGDFNEWTRGLASRLMGNAFRVAEPRSFLRYRRTYPGVFPILHLDHFYYDASMSLVRIRLHRTRMALVASDHLPLVADFTLGSA
jgi:endonuclease/exonuclease/phosphatase family metal-dependent hydrolase